MKSLIKVIALGCLWGLITMIMPHSASAQQVSVSFQMFYDDLSPYGSWVDYQNYGYVWIPAAGGDFSPYGSNGHWIYTDDGWTWVSDYPWGWAPFHYGRWAYDDSYGWLWVPGDEWGPAWVTWRRSEGYYGWAPMEPGVSIELSFGGGRRVRDDHWMFVRDRDFGRPDIEHRYVDRSTNVTIINSSTVINNTYSDNSRHSTYVAGPRRDDVEKTSGNAVKPVVIRENDKPGQSLSNDQLQIYRPRVAAGNVDNHKPVPAKIVSLREVKPVSGRTPGSTPDAAPLPANRTEQSTTRQNATPARANDAAVQPSASKSPVRNTIPEHPAQPQDARPIGRNDKRQQPPVVSTPVRTNSTVQPSAPRAAKPSTRKVRQPKIDSATPPAKAAHQPARGVAPSGNRANQQKPQNVAPPRENAKAQSSQPAASQDEKGKEKKD